ncbi:scavenger receptor cysteine-rich type 1 protein M160-like [Polymixia lowei]
MCVGFILRNSETYWVADMEKLNIAGIIIYITMAGATMVTGPSESASVRLVNGTGPCSGRVEVYHRGQWGTVCDNSWDIIDAKVVCRQLGCGKALDTKYRAYFGEGSGDILMSGVTCSGSEETLLQCNHKRVGSIKCGHDEDAGVVCSGRVDVRVAAGFGRCSGRVEVYRDDQWGTVCATDGYYWTAMMTGMFCEELGCGKAVKYKPMAFFGESSGKIAVTDVWCYREDYFSDCPESSRKRHCDHTHEVGVLCSDTVQLVGGPDRCSGRVEVHYNDQWGSVCGDEWDLDDAQVVCRELGCGGSVGVKRGAHFGEGGGPIWMSGVQCSGQEESLTRCLHDDSASHSCGHDDDAGVICSESVKVRLVNGTSRCSGGVEVYYDGQWRTVCGEDWDISEAEVVCRQLRCGRALDYKNKSFFREGSEIWMSGVNCSGLEDSLGYCLHNHSGSHSCGHNAGVVCSDSVEIRLVSGSQPCSGRVEVNYGGQWGRVCGDDWDLNDAEVVCRQIGCGQALEALGPYFGVGKEPVLLYGVNCSGQESSLTQCVQSGSRISSCGQQPASGVICSHLRLVNGTSHCSGRVEVCYDGQWGTVCGENWDLNDAEVTCRQMNCGRALSAKNSSYFGEGSGPIWMSGVQCSGLEESLTRCLHSDSAAHSCGHDDEAGVICSESIDVRLFGGPDPCSGSVEALYKGGAVVCSRGWDMADAEVVCRHLGCGKALDISQNRLKFGLKSDAMFSLHEVACSGQESSLSQCQNEGWKLEKCPFQLVSDTAVVTCSACKKDTVCSDNIDVKLVKGTGRCSGVVETSYRGQRGRVCYGKYEWQGSVCGWRIYDAAKTVCKQLECGPPITAVRLVDGPDRCSGRVEVNHDGQWGTVCDDEWDLNDAEVVCREMGCGSALSAKRRAYFGPGIREIWMNKLRCSGEEESFKRCPHSGFGRHDCGHHQDAGVVCSGAVRLANGTDHCSGRLEVYRHGQWGTVCDEDWDMRDARVVCRELGCGKAVDVKTKAFFGEGSGEVSMSRVKCGGREESVAHCSHSRPGSETCGHQQDAGVVCSASLTESVKVRLANGPDGCMGTVEVYRNGQWGTVCGVDWGLREADVVCRQMGCGMALEVKHSAFFGEGSGGILMSNVKCSGSEDYLSQCTHNPLGMQRCGHSDDVGVVCAERVKARLVNGRADGCSGRVEVFYRGQWGTVAGFDWGMEDAEVVCREIGCGKAEKRTLWGNSGSGSGEVWMSSVACSGQELLLTQCPHKGWGEEDRHGFDVSVTCLGPVRLVGWFDPCAGRVEVYRHSQWGTVCDDDWDMKEAEVVCRQLNCGTALYVKHRAEFGEGSGEIWMSGVQCSGLEESLTHCRHKSPGHHSCGHERDAGLVCSKSVQVRLTNGTDGCSGRVEVYYNGQWGRVDSAGWDMNEAMVVCRELDCGKAKDARCNSYFGDGSGEIMMTDVKCSGLESSLRQCHHLRPETQFHGQDAGVVCSGSPEVRLVNGTSRCSGRVEIYHDNDWGTICHDDWDMNDGDAVCRQLDCGKAMAVKQAGYFGMGTSRMWGEPGCSGNESSLTQCPNKGTFPHGCTHHQDAGLICSGNVRLVNGYDRCSGRVEVYQRGQWGTVCDKDWDTRDTDMVCRELGCGRALDVKQQTFFGEGRGEVLMANVRCSGSERSLLLCPQDQSETRNCGHHEDVGLVCTESVKVRLVNGTDRCSGRVEVYYNGQWGAVCGDGWDMKDAEVVCREVVCGRAESVEHGADYVQGNGQRWMTGVQCLGNERSLTQCSHEGFGRHECQQTANAAVRCSAMVRLANGGRCHGRVEIYHDDAWGTVCNRTWDMNDANVFCQELGCKTALRLAHHDTFGRSRLSNRIWTQLQCSGHESSISQCNLREHDGGYSCTASANVGVYCSDVVKLVGGSDRCSGTVDVYHDGQWGAVCGDGWDRQSAAVVCRQLGCGDGVRLYHTDFSRSIDLNVSCSGEETSFQQCAVEQVHTDCNLNGHAAVICSVSDSRLQGGIHGCSGRVEVYSAGQWTERCFHDVGLETKTYAESVCRHLGCGGLRYLLPNCDSKTPEVICAAESWVRLVNGTDRCSGRVEVYHGGQWGTVCGDSWSLSDAKVVCKELGCGQARAAPGGAYFGQGNGPIWQADHHCFADEMSLMRCSLNGFNTTSCGHNQDAAVICSVSDGLRLVDGPHWCSGTVEIFRVGQWSTVCDSNWGMKQAKLVCRELGCGIALAAPRGSHFGRGRGPILKHSLQCNDGETSVTMCPLDIYDDFEGVTCDHNSDASVICSVSLPKPDILVSPGTEVSRGHSLDITCSITPPEIFQGGWFTLEQDAGSFRLERQSNNNSVTFVIPSVDSGHDGFYHCRFQKQVEGTDLFSPYSDSIRVYVAGTGTQSAP